MLFRSDGSWTESVLYAFKEGNDGEIPKGALALDPSRNLYGATLGGGQSSYGTVYRLTPSLAGAWSKTILHSFTGSFDGVCLKEELRLTALATSMERG